MIVNQKILGQVVQNVDNAIHQINHYPALSSVVCFANTYLLDSYLSGDGIIQPLNNWGLMTEVLTI